MDFATLKKILGHMVVFCWGTVQSWIQEVGGFGNGVVFSRDGYFYFYDPGLNFDYGEMIKD